MYGRRPLSTVHQTITDMGVTHYVLENSWCVRKTRDGCQMPEIWDLEDIEFRVTITSLSSKYWLFGGLAISNVIITHCC